MILRRPVAANELHERPHRPGVNWRLCFLPERIELANRRNR